MESLNHLTLNTGHVASLQTVPQEVLDRISAIVDAEGGEIPGLPGWHLDILRPMTADHRPIPGAAFFQVANEPGLSKTPVVMAMACWDEDRAEGSWEQICGAYTMLRPALKQTGQWREPPSNPPKLPWLAVITTPALSAAPPKIIGALGDLERCVAWALMQ